MIQLWKQSKEYIKTILHQRHLILPQLEAFYLDLTERKCFKKVLNFLLEVFHNIMIAFRIYHSKYFWILQFLLIFLWNIPCFARTTNFSSLLEQIDTVVYVYFSQCVCISCIRLLLYWHTDPGKLCKQFIVCIRVFYCLVYFVYSL